MAGQHNSMHCVYIALLTTLTLAAVPDATIIVIGALVGVMTHIAQKLHGIEQSTSNLLTWSFLYSGWIPVWEDLYRILPAMWSVCEEYEKKGSVSNSEPDSGQRRY